MENDRLRQSLGHFVRMVNVTHTEFIIQSAVTCDSNSQPVEYNWLTCERWTHFSVGMKISDSHRSRPVLAGSPMCDVSTSICRQLLGWEYVYFLRW